MLSLFNIFQKGLIYKTLIIFLPFFYLFPVNSLAHGENKVIKAFKTYTKLPRESVFVHLNKSTLITGEFLGFKAYVIDKGTNKLSQSSSNLYGLITDEDDTPVKKGLFIVKEGTTANFFENYGVIDWIPNLEVDSNGDYNFKLLNTNSQSINLYIEGITSHGIYISKFKNVKL